MCVCVCLTPTPAVCRPPQRHYRPTGHHTLCPTVLHDAPLLCLHALMDHQRDAPGQTLKLYIHTKASRYFPFTWEYICDCVCVYVSVSVCIPSTGVQETAAAWRLTHSPPFHTVRLHCSKFSSCPSQPTVCQWTTDTTRRDRGLTRARAL